MPIDRVEASYASSLAAITPYNQAKADGIAIGQAAAAAMLADRANHGRYGTFRFTAGTHVGEWRPELPNSVSDPFAWIARVRPFTMKSTSQFRTAGPLDMASPEYATEFNEVKTMGVLEGSSRTDAQTLEARFYATNPLPMMNRASPGRGGARPVDHPGRAILRDDEHVLGRRPDRLLGRQGLLELLAPDLGNQPRGR